MGLAIAERLMDCGCAVTVRDIRASRERLARRAGATVADSPQAAARETEIVLSVVVDAEQTEEVLFGTAGVVAGARPGTVVLLCSTLGPEVARKTAARLAKHRLLMIDAPMSGGPARARDGTMSMMIAGSPAAQRRAARVLAMMSDRRFDFGTRAGDAATAKIVNNLLAGANLAAAAEGLTLGIHCGLDPERLLDLVGSSSGQSWIGEERMRRAVRGDYVLRASPAMLAKDLGLAIDAAAGLSIPTPLASATRALFLAALAQGYEPEDDASILKVYDALAGRRSARIRNRALSGRATTRRSRS